MECTNHVCSMRRVGERRRKGSEWWNEEVGRASSLGMKRCVELGMKRCVGELE